MHPDAGLYFICGTDSFLKLDSWMNAHELLANYSFIVGCDRPGYRHYELEEAISRISAKYGTEIIIVQNRQFDISSTEIRDNVAEGRAIDDLVPAPVERYIREHGLYRI